MLAKFSGSLKIFCLLAEDITKEYFKLCFTQLRILVLGGMSFFIHSIASGAGFRSELSNSAFPRINRPWIFGYSSDVNSDIRNLVFASSTIFTPNPALGQKSGAIKCPLCADATNCNPRKVAVIY